MKNPQTHFIGVGGIGMSALARLLLLKQKAVSGSDKKDSDLIHQLESIGLKSYKGHDPINLPQEGRVVVSTGIRSDNPELMGCDPKRHEVIHRSTLLKELMEEARPLVVAGSHGKTTTSSLLATVFTEAGKNPSWAVGGIVQTYGTNAALGSGEYFIAEADESDGTHVKYHPYGLIVTNIDEEHMDHYKSREALIASFEALMSQAQESQHLFYCFDDPILKALHPKGISYGFMPGADLQITAFKQLEGKILFDLEWKGKQYLQIELPLIGKHSALNGAAVFGLSLSLGIDESAIRKGFLHFKGAKRRLEFRLNKREAWVIEDYAHHPKEIEATLKALKEAYPDRGLNVIFQPHRYTRTQLCMDQFKDAFASADNLFVTDIYSAGEVPIAGITATSLINAIGKATYVPFSEVAAKVKALLKPFEIIVLMGAGDIGEIGEQARDFDPRRLKVACLFGGKSKEHEVSLVSARGVTSHLNPELFEPVLIGITPEGRWVEGASAKQMLEGAPFEGDETAMEKALKALSLCDLAFPILHGPFGEDGTLQGLFEMLSIPYVGCGVESSAIAMNKATSKKLAEAAGVPVAPYVAFTQEAWQLEKSAILQAIAERLTYPVFVKAVHLGSSIGIFKVKSDEDLLKSIKEAFTYDKELIVEQGVQGREIECAIYGNGPWSVSNPGEILTGGEFYDYEKKYGKNGFVAAPKAELSESEKEEVKALALKIYRALGCDGMARVDLFYGTEGLLFNEVNPIPGFTPISLFPKMFEAMGLSYSTLITTLCAQALYRSRKAYALK